ncbi:MAG TPA: 1,2-phenylacetyl-CoA epoxidase subunit PaaD [Deinococcales bacterium]|nr:1,2-phenylacetyl-CoA epoxidase subunit PaaD [Deinococcales bacterium]
MTGASVSPEAVWAVLATVPDPEIPTVSMVDLGIIEAVRVTDGVEVELLPTFSGCPALDWMRQSVEEALAPLGLPVRVSVNRRATWHSDRITPQGREKLRASGFAPPPVQGLLELSSTLPDLDVELADGVACPHCGSRETTLDTPFGPTLCRAIYRCRSCRQPFEQFKPV